MGGLRGPAIRVKAYGVLVHPDAERFLVVRYAQDDYVCHRLPGGTVEFLELSSEALRREMREELGIEIEVPVPIGVLENMVAEVPAQHDVIFVFAHRLTEAVFGDEGGTFTDDAGTMWAQWRRFDAVEPDLFPAGLDQILPNALAWT